ncbi:MAG: hypothetical protein KDD11_17720, partial [Acidobacteria bacterium]|nr:hypothetical protein [Acidobacteriota bacterium]
LRERTGEAVSDEDLRTRFKNLSEEIEQLGEAALEAVVNRVCGRIEPGDEADQRRIGGLVPDLGFDLQPCEAGWYLPLRPLILGGDDLTFVCDGRLALDLAVTVLEVFEGFESAELGALHGCAGIALVHTHFPFARAYDWAETLCGSAKGHLLATRCEGSALDWHIGSPLPNQSLETLREREYRNTEGKRLTLRPYRLGTDPQEAEGWRFLSQELLDGAAGFRRKRWERHRNKVQELAKLVREGPDAVEVSLQAWRVAAPHLEFPKPLTDRGFDGDSTPLLDAVELIDLHLPLEAPPKPTADPQEVTS